LQVVPIPGTDFGFEPFLSPDGTQLAFFDRLPPRLRVVGLGGGSAITIADSAIGGSGSWGSDGFLYVSAPRTGGGIVRIPSGGKKPERVSTPDSAKGELQHVSPEVLPNGKAVLFAVRRGSPAESGIAVVELSTGVHRELVRGVRARYAASGHLVYVTSDGALLAVTFDQNRLTLGGSPVTLAEGLRVGRGGGSEFVLAADGTLAYFIGSAPGAAQSDRLVWRDRNGVVTEVDSTWSVDFSANALSPDGTRLATGIRDAEGRLQVWIKQLDRGPRTRLTFAGTNNFAPAWTPDGRAVAFVSSQTGGSSDLYLQRADGGAEATLLLHVPQPIAQAIWSPDGKWLVFQTTASPSADIYAIRPGVDSAPVALMATSAHEAEPALSPDGRWLAYGSNETGQAEVYMRPFPNASSARWPVSTGGGRPPRWAHSGRELFYSDSKDNLVTAEVRPGATFAVGEQRVLFSMEGFGRWLPAPGDQRFLMVRSRSADVRGDLIVVENFFEELKAKVGKRP
jgi:serine/threonine-protein kinase